MPPDQLMHFYKASWALVVGINDYQHASPLSYARNDAEAFSAILQDKFYFPAQHIRLLVDSDAARDSILDTFVGFREGGSVDDRVIVFFAGHGHTEQGARGPIGYLIPCDGSPERLASLIAFDDLVRIGELIPAKHLLFVMDACYGGLVLRRTVQPGTQRFLSDMIQRPCRQVITAGKADETVADGGGPGGQNSIFTGFLIEGLQGAAASPDGVLTANSLMNYVYERVGRDNRSRQTPSFGYLDGEGDLVFSAPGTIHLSPSAKVDYIVQVPPGMPAPSLPPQPQHRRSFLERNGYADPLQPSFGRNIWSAKLLELRIHKEAPDEIVSAFSWLSLVMEPSAEAVISIDIPKELARLPYPKPADAPFFTRFAVPPHSQTTLDSAIRFDPSHRSQGLWNSYLRIEKTGNIEYAEGYNVFMVLNNVRLFQYVTLVGLTWQFMFLAKDILAANGYEAGVRLTVNIVGTRDTILAEFSDEPGKDNEVWAEPFKSGPFGYHEELLELKCPDQNIQLSYDIVLSSLDEGSSKQVALDLATQLGLAYNHQSAPRCFSYETDVFPWRRFLQSRNYR